MSIVQSAMDFQVVNKISIQRINKAGDNAEEKMPEAARDGPGG